MEDPFAGFRRFEEHVLEGLNRGDRSAQKSKRLLGVINQTLVTTHEMVILRLEKLENAKTVAEANALLEALRIENLTEAFRVEGLCDLLEGLGSGLLSRAWAAKDEGVFAEKELEEVEEFGQALYDREAEVARIYSEALSEVTGRGPQLDEASLPDLKLRVRELRDLLTGHVSDFNAKADKFMRVARP